MTDGVFTLRQFRRREWPEALPYDPGEARALLEAAGWVDRDGDGVREKDGRPFRFTASVSTTTTWGMAQLAVYVQDFLRRVGVQMETQPVEAASMWGRLKSGDFEAWMHVGQSFPGALQRDFGRGNATGYDNREAFRVLDHLMATADPDEHDALYRRLAEIYRADMPFTRLIPASTSWFVHRRVGGLSTPAPSVAGHVHGGLMGRSMISRTHRHAVLAAIARRQWLLQMLALGAVAGCRRRDDDPAYARGNTLVMAYPENRGLRYDELACPEPVSAPPGSGDDNGELRTTARPKLGALRRLPGVRLITCAPTCAGLMACRSPPRREIHAGSLEPSRRAVCPTSMRSRSLTITP